MATQIRFGTSGWRAVMAEEFTFANVRRAVTGIARYVASQNPAGARVIVGRDPRFLGETFCAMAAEILAGHGITALVIAEAAPTPTDRKSTRLNSSHSQISYAVFCLKKKKKHTRYRRRRRLSHRVQGVDVIGRGVWAMPRDNARVIENVELVV